MIGRLAAVVLALALAGVLPVRGDGLSTLIVDLFGPGGLFVESEAPLPDGSTHSAHFNSAFQSEFTQLNIAIASELTALPIPSPASGFTYVFDPASGEFTRSSKSFGPIFAERAETIGRGKFAFGFNVQVFDFDTIEGVDLSEVPAVFTHDNPAPGGRADVVTTMNDLEVSLGQSTFFLSYGLTNRLDLSLAVPVINTEIDASSTAVVRRLGTGQAVDVHFYDEEGVRFGDTRTFSSSGSASGLGDIIVRLKGTAVRSERAGLALGLDVRAPTGDELDLLGSGSLGVKPFLAASFGAGDRIFPHLNLAYQFNDDSVLAGSVVTGEKGELPDQWTFAVGADFALSAKFTLALDILGRHVIDSPRLREVEFTGLDEEGTMFRDIAFETESFTETSAAVGFKVNPTGRFLIDFNLLFALNDAGLRTDVAPLLGFEYFF